MRTQNSVCYHCPNMVVGCHATCPDYLKEAAENQARNDSRRMNNLAKNILADTYVQTEERYSRTSGHRIKMKGWR